MIVIHSQPADRYLLCPVSVPESEAEARTIHKAARSAGAIGSRVYRGSRLVGEVLDHAAWPHAFRGLLRKGDDTVKPVELPAGTIYVGFQLTPSAWRDWQAGELSLSDLRFEPRGGSVAKGKKKNKIRKGSFDYTSNPAVPAQGNRTMPRAESGRFVSSIYQGGPTGGSDYDRQASRPGPYANVDTEASSRYGPGTHSGSGKVGTGDLVASAIARGRNNIQRYSMHIQSPHARLMAGIAARQQIVEFGIGPDAQPVATDRYNPAVSTAPPDLNPAVWTEVLTKIKAMTQLFRERCGRYPVAGQPVSQDDVEYWSAVDAVLDQYYGPGAGFSGPADGGYNPVQW